MAGLDGVLLGYGLVFSPWEMGYLLNGAVTANAHGLGAVLIIFNLLYKELSFALLRTDSEKIKKWGSQSAKRFIKLAGRRINALSSLVVSVSKARISEVRKMFGAWREGRAGEHFGDRTATAIDSTIGIARAGAKLIGGIGSGHAGISPTTTTTRR